jgi:phosphate transport system substrate-binding protein
MKWQFRVPNMSRLLRAALSFAIGGLIVLGIVGCGKDTPTPEPMATDIAGEISFAGSTTLQPLAHEIGEAFKDRHPDVALDIAAGGSVVGIEAIHDGTVDVGMASRALTSEEAEGIEQHQVAADVIAMVVHGSNPVEDITLEQLRDIYLGEITDWSEVGGNDGPITVVVRGKNSGTRGAFDKIVLDKQEPVAPHLRTAVAASDVAAMVAEDEQAIGYIGFGHFELDIKVIAVDGVMPSEETARDGSYAVVRPLLFLTGPLSQPIAQEFIDFALSAEGQRMVVDEGWVPAR